MIYYHVKEDRNMALIKHELITFSELNNSNYKKWNFNKMLDNGAVELVELSQHKTYKTHGIRFMDHYTRDSEEYKVIEYNHMVTQLHERLPNYYHALEPTDLDDLKIDYESLINDLIHYDKQTKEQTFYFLDSMTIYANPPAELSETDKDEIEQEIYEFNEYEYLYNLIKEVTA